MRAGLTRRNLLQSAVAAGGLLGTGFVTPFTPAARAMQPGGASRTDPADSISREFARWVTGLRYDDLPPEVVDRARKEVVLTLKESLALLLAVFVSACDQSPTAPSPITPTEQ